MRDGRGDGRNVQEEARRTSWQQRTRLREWIARLQLNLVEQV